MDYKINHGFLPCCIECQIINILFSAWNQFKKDLYISSESIIHSHNLIYSFNYYNTDTVYYNLYFLKLLVMKIFKNNELDLTKKSEINELIDFSLYIEKYTLFINLVINIFPVEVDKKEKYKEILLSEFSKEYFDNISKSLDYKINICLLFPEKSDIFKELVYLLLTLSKLDVNKFIINIIKSIEKSIFEKSAKWNIESNLVSFLDLIIDYEKSFRNVCELIFYNFLKNENIKLINSTVSSTFLDIIYSKNKDTLNTQFESLILKNDFKTFLKIYNLFRIENNSLIDYVDLINEIICKNIDNYFENKITGVFPYVQNLIYLISYVNPFPNRLDKLINKTLKKNISISKKFNEEFCNLLLNPTKLKLMLIPSTFSHFYNFINNKQSLIDKINNIVSKILLTDFYSNNSLLSVEKRIISNKMLYLNYFVSRSLLSNNINNIQSINKIIDNFKNKKYNTLISYIQYHLFEITPYKIKILNNLYWNFETENINLPNEFNKMWNFTKLNFKKKYTSKVLSLSTRYSYAHLYDNVSKTNLNLPLILACLLIEIDNNVNTKSKIIEKLNISNNYFENCLDCLIKNDLIEDNDSFLVVKKYVKDITLYPWDISDVKKNNSIIKKESKDNSFYLKALLVRIMKKNREMEISELISEYQNREDSFFKCKKEEIEKMIKKLVDDDYFESENSKIIYVP